jgi:hypothetical protein
MEVNIIIVSMIVFDDHKIKKDTKLCTCKKVKFIEKNFICLRKTKTTNKEVI